jgi:hypothetical protein
MKVEKTFFKAVNQVNFFYLVNFLCPESESESAFPIRIRIQESKINADPCGSKYTTLLKI